MLKDHSQERSVDPHRRPRRGGEARTQVEEHIATQLEAGPHGSLHVPPCRPQYRAVQRLPQLAPLSDAQQESFLKNRLGDDSTTSSSPSKDKVPLDPDTSPPTRVTANPLMLSMIASIAKVPPRQYPNSRGRPAKPISQPRTSSLKPEPRPACTIARISPSGTSLCH